MSLDAVRKEAARVAAHVDLRDVRLWGLSSELHNVPNEDDTALSYKFDSDVQVHANTDAAMVLVLGAFSLNMSAVPLTTAEGEDTPEPEDVATVQFQLNALFQIDVEPDEPFTESELTAFGQTTGQFALYPYARELVANLTGRMGLPALHMGVMRLNLETRDG